MHAVRAAHVLAAVLPASAAARRDALLLPCRKPQLDALVADEQQRQSDARAQLQQGAARCQALPAAQGPAAVGVLRAAAAALLALLDGVTLPGDLLPAEEGEGGRGGLVVEGAVHLVPVWHCHEGLR